MQQRRSGLPDEEVQLVFAEVGKQVTLVLVDDVSAKILTNDHIPRRREGRVDLRANLPGHILFLGAFLDRFFDNRSALSFGFLGHVDDGHLQFSLLYHYNYKFKSPGFWGFGVTARLNRVRIRCP